MDEYKKIANVGFLGRHFFEGIYKEKVYLAVFHFDYVTLMSREPITEFSNPFKFGFKTKVKLDELDDLLQCKMYATYKGNEYEVLDVASEFKNLLLKARDYTSDDVMKEDQALGFIYDHEERMSEKFVTPDELDSIRVEKHSVKEEFLQQYHEGE
ncbi:MAG: hypothetical protein E7278_10425 [Lachnospiraceae bacterium]|jgi:hypothetical protein|nr:hypothetical protein [Lachnospiraceae bacterium]